MRLVEYENTIKNKVAKDPSDISIYDDLQKMAIVFLRRKKACRSIQDYEDVSYLIAGDIYIKISKQEKISYYLGYLEKIYRRYIISFYQNNHSNETVSYENEDFERTLIYPGSYDDYTYIDNKLYLSNIKVVIDKVLEKSCKYATDPLSSLNISLSLLLSLLQEDIVSYNITPEQEFYLNMITVNFYSQVFSDVFCI